MQPLYGVIWGGPQGSARSHTPMIRNPHQENCTIIYLVRALGHWMGEEKHKRWASSFQRMLSTPWPARVCFRLQSVSNYCGTLGIWIHLQWIPLQLLPDIWDQSGLRRWCACCGNVDSLTDAGFWCHGISEPLAWSREENERGRREIESEIQKGDRSGERERGREGGKREIFLDCPLSFKHFIGFREREEEERGKKKRGEREG